MAPSGAAVAAPIAASAHDAENCYTLCHRATHCDTYVSNRETHGPDWPLYHAIILRHTAGNYTSLRKGQL